MKKYLFFVTLLFFLLFTGVLFAGTLKVYFLDVGQGDSTLMISSTGEVVMIDSGPDENLILQKLKELKISHIDLLIASHPHADHTAGMDKVIDIYKPRAFIDSGIPHTTKTYENLLLSLKRNNIKYYQATARKISLGPLLFSILPPADPRSTESELHTTSA
ncbi:MAG: MBL fold metallo-hydrolase, partial [Bacteroidia bacterium]|nr:MBL fold metallo-hydrolase [Bacteroidia bacterium]